MQSDALEFFVSGLQIIQKRAGWWLEVFREATWNPCILTLLQVERKGWSLFTGEDPLSSHWS